MLQFQHVSHNITKISRICKTSIRDALPQVESVGTTPGMVAQSAGAVEYTASISTEGWGSPNECPGYDTKQSDGKALVMLDLWGMRSTRLLASFPSPLYPGVVAPVEVPVV